MKTIPDYDDIEQAQGWYNDLRECLSYEEWSKWWRDGATSDTNAEHVERLNRDLRELVAEFGIGLLTQPPIAQQRKLPN